MSKTSVSGPWAGLGLEISGWSHDSAVNPLVSSGLRLDGVWEERYNDSARNIYAVLQMMAFKVL